MQLLSFNNLFLILLTTMAFIISSAYAFRSGRRYFGLPGIGGFRRGPRRFYGSFYGGPGGFYGRRRGGFYGRGYGGGFFGAAALPLPFPVAIPADVYDYYDY